ncbi:MAG: hypothetical protein JWO46_1808 [Nocardioidaceae bacterium]|nr:hypothetical protein [Nocardioidaceae bacterium]
MTDLDELAIDLKRVGREVGKALNKAAGDLARDGNRDGKAFARESAGSHGHLYPRAWKVEKLGSADFVFGPDPSMPQGDMNFETGSRNQKPHLDGQRAGDLVESRAERAVSAAVDPILRLLG